MTHSWRGLAVDEPLVALKALDDVWYVIAWTGQDAICELAARDVPLDDVATARSASEAAARGYLNNYLHP
ncbi:hypothetical protein ACF087_34650 [Streptomyces goshikiensis]|uniref:hypothetical protein n=1 Tax=Streptomyces goshikiensis TaxID=1942 RepID=UPI0036FB8090